MTSQPELGATSPKSEERDDEAQLAEALRKLALASIGAVSLAEEAAEKVLRRLILRGETDWQNARLGLGRLKAVKPRLPRPPRPLLKISGETLASKDDVRALQQRLDALSAQIESLATSASEGV